MRLLNFAISFAVGGLLLAGCSGDEDETPGSDATPAVAATPAPTATPFARLPEPIIVTGQGVPGTSPASEDAVQYTVEAGDTLGGIAERFGVPTDAVRQANDIEDDSIFIGQVLTIPRGTTVSTGDTPGTPGGGTTPPGGASPDGDTYVVVAGDTAFGIALEFDTTVEALAAANGMTEDEITDLQIGQVINLPRPE